MKLIYLLIALLFLSFACSSPQKVKQDPPQPVQMVWRTLGADTLESEPGIDAEVTPGEELNAIRLQWYKHPLENDLKEYRVYRSVHNSGLINFYLLNAVELNQATQDDTVYSDQQELDLSTRYYYYITAVDKDGQESEPSDTVSYKLVAKAQSLSVNDNPQVITSPDLRFKWFDATTESFFIRIEAYVTDDFHPLVHTAQVPSIYSDDGGFQHYRLQGDWLKTKFPDGDYRWRIDCVGTENDVARQSFSGSESDWSFFKIQWSN